MSNLDTKRKPNESYEDYCDRMYRMQGALGHTNDVMGYIINQNVDEKEVKDESAHRKSARIRIKAFDRGYEEGLKCVRDDYSVRGLDSLIPKTHLEKMQEMVGEYGIKKRDMQLERLELARLYREVTPVLLFAEQYSLVIKENLEFVIPEELFDIPYDEMVGESVVKGCPADWHTGVLIDEEYNYHDHKKAEEKIDYYADKLMEYAKMFNAKMIDITHLGDIIEHFDMRNQQKWNCEFATDKQLVEGENLTWRLVIRLMKNGFKVRLGGIYGNHDRITGSKHDAVENNTAMYVIIQNMKNSVTRGIELYGKELHLLEFADQPEDYEHQVDEIYGNRIRYQHGHNDAKNDERKIEKYNGVDDDSYDILVFGHLHHGRVIHKNRNEMEIYGGTLQGSNSYGKNKVKSTADASQLIIVFRDNGDVLPFEVNLQHI